MADCNVLRRKLVKHGTLNPATGVSKTDREEWVIEPCGTPLFGYKAEEPGMCRGCAAEWIHEHNYPCDRFGELVGKADYVRGDKGWVQPDPKAAAMVSEAAEIAERFDDYELGDL